MIQLVGELFTQLDTDQSGKLSYEELDSHLHDEALQEYFCVLEMEPEKAKDLFCLLDIKGEGEVSITDFTNGCLKIMGAPKNLDICTCLYQSRRMIILLEASQHFWQKREMRMQTTQAWSWVCSVQSFVRSFHTANASIGQSSFSNGINLLVAGVGIRHSKFGCGVCRNGPFSTPS